MIFSQNLFRRPVDDAHNLRDPVARERLAQTVHDGDGAGDGGLVVEVRARRRRGGVELGAMGGEEGLVARDDARSRLEGPQDEGPRRLDAADELDDEIHPVDRLSRVGREEGAVDLGVAGRVDVADEDRADAHEGAGTGREVLGLFAQDADDLRTDGSGAENSDAQFGKRCGHGDSLGNGSDARGADHSQHRRRPHPPSARSTPARVRPDSPPETRLGPRSWIESPVREAAGGV